MEEVRIDRHELVNHIRAYGRACRQFGYGRATDVEVDAAFKAVLDIIYPPFSWEKKDEPAVSGIERASKSLDDMSMSGMRPAIYGEPEPEVPCVWVRKRRGSVGGPSQRYSEELRMYVDSSEG